MKKILLVLCSLFLSFSLFSCKDGEESNSTNGLTGETSTQEELPSKVNIYLPDGTPALAMANVLDEGFNYKNVTTNFHIVPADQIGPSIIKNADLGIMPVVAAAKIYQNASIQLLSVNVFGSLHIVGTKQLSNVSDLVGKLVYVTTGTTIDMMKYILTKNNIAFVEQGEVAEGYVALSSMPSAADIIPLLKKATTMKQEAYGVLGEPVVTKALNANPDLKLTFDLQKLYKDINGSDGYSQAGLVVKSTFMEKYPGYVNALIEKLQGNKDYCLNHTSELPTIFGKYESSLAGMTFTADTIERCNIRIQKASEIKTDIIKYVKDLANIDLNDHFFA